jgi:hypothetical protein
LFEEATWKLGGALQKTERRQLWSSWNGRLVGPRVKKETAAPVGGKRRRRFSAAAAEQSPMGLEVSSLVFFQGCDEIDLAFCLGQSITRIF